MVATYRLSIMLPMYNPARTIGFALNSLRDALDALPLSRQVQVEVVICDNHSTDGTRVDYLGSTLPSSVAVRTVRPPGHEPNRTRNWSVGLDACRGQWLMMLHADDALTPSALRAVLDSLDFADCLNAQLILGRHQNFVEEHSPERPEPPHEGTALIDGDWLRNRVLSIACFVAPFTAFRAATYREVGGLNEDYELTQDWDLWIRLLSHGPALYLPNFTGLWRMHGYSPEGARRFASEYRVMRNVWGSDLPVRDRLWAELATWCKSTWLSPTKSRPFRKVAAVGLRGVETLVNRRLATAYEGRRRPTAVPTTLEGAT